MSDVYRGIYGQSILDPVTGEPVTSTDLGAGVRALDINVAGGSITVDSEFADAILSSDGIPHQTTAPVISLNLVYDPIDDDWNMARGISGFDGNTSTPDDEILAGVILRKPGAGGSDVLGDSTNPLIVAQSLVPFGFDYIGLTYVAAGDGAGEIETVIYKTGGSGGTTLATLTLGYDGSNRLDEVTRS